MDEDIGSGDLSSASLFSGSAQATAVILAKQDGVLAGLPVAEEVFRSLDAGLHWKSILEDGKEMHCGQTAAEMKGRLLAILAGERVALNFLQRMSGIATLTRQFVKAVEGLGTRILDTRKTVPGLRMLDKYAVRMGGGCNHRFGLYDGVLLKDNHIQAAGGVRNAVKGARQNLPPIYKIEVEVRSLPEVEEALAAHADLLLLDNMSPEEMQQAVRFIERRVPVEASGCVTLETVREIAATGVDFISIGALTHSVRALDLSLEVTPSHGSAV